MSCEIRLTATIENVPAIRRCLFPMEDKGGSDSWLQTCKIAPCPTGDLIVLANDRKLAILDSKWDSTTSSNTFQMNFSGSMHECDKIKAALCLPVISETSSSHVGPDWTCIVLGFDSGFVRFYTEQGDLLCEEQFHNQNITSVKCQSQHSPRPDLCPELRPEELYVQYQNVICLIGGQQLFENLRHFRSRLAKGELVNANNDGSELKVSPLIVRKWGFQDQSSINDVAVIGLNMSNTFDHLLTVSTCGGFEEKYRNTAPNSTLVLAAGHKPFLGFHYALEGANQPILSDVAKAVATKLKSALPGWLGRSKMGEVKETVVQRPLDNMGLRFGLSDPRRTGLEVVLTPDKKLAAVADNLGRVTLVDSYRGFIIKNLKGYREAQCAFLQVPDERHSKHRPGNKLATFLLVYSPKKGTLEIFTVQNGTKIATFSTSKHSRLVYITHGLMGFAATTKSRFLCQFTCIFLDSDGQIREIFVPFHFSLAEKNGVRARDIHLYKKLRQLLRSDRADTKKGLELCSELKTVEIKSQTLELLMKTEEIASETLSKCLEYFLEDGQDKDNFKIVCNNVRDMLNLYSFSEEKVEEDSVEKENGLDLDPRDLSGLQKLLDLATSSGADELKVPRVKFSDNHSRGVSKFLACFAFGSDKGASLKDDIDEELLFATAETLFDKYITGRRRDYDRLAQSLSSSKLSTENLFRLAMHYWINKSLDVSLNLEQDMGNFAKIIAILVKRDGRAASVDSGSDKLSTFWQNVRDGLADSSRPFPALMAAILCKKVLKEYELDGFEDNIELLTQENVQWSLLIGKLEDVSALNIILTSKINCHETSLPKLSHDIGDISLKYILQQGRGAVSELAAQWLTSYGLEPNRLVQNEAIFKNSQSADETSEAAPDSTGQVTDEGPLKYLNILKRQFPYSLEAGTLLANMCWEYALAWRRAIGDLNYLRAAIGCLGSIPDQSVKFGLYQLVWNAQLKIVLEGACKLINKVGKLPKDRLCRQDTGLSDKEITDFVDITTEFMDSFLEVAQKDTDRPVLKFEAIWDNGGQQPLVELAVQQKSIDYNLLHLHYQLCLVLLMITKFPIKHSKPVNNLFEASSGNLLFTDLNQRAEINWNKSDIKINSSRDQFLRKVISCTLETITLDENGQIYCTKHVEWMDKCLNLARIWNLGVDSLRRFQIAQLYRSGFDLLAQDLLPIVNEPKLLGEELLVVAANRLSQFLTASPNLSENIAALSPILSRYMKSVDNENGNWCSPSNLENIKMLANQALRCIGEDERELFKLAELLVDTCGTLEDINRQL